MSSVAVGRGPSCRRRRKTRRVGVRLGFRGGRPARAMGREAQDTVTLLFSPSPPRTQKNAFLRPHCLLPRDCRRPGVRRRRRDQPADRRAGACGQEVGACGRATRNKKRQQHVWKKTRVSRVGTHSSLSRRDMARPWAHCRTRRVWREKAGRGGMARGFCALELCSLSTLYPSISCSRLSTPFPK